jgi:hypothetical protein
MTIKLSQHISWVEPSHLDLRWDPAYFAPEFIGLDQKLSNHAKDYVNLGNIVEISRNREYYSEETYEKNWIARIHHGVIEF